MFVGIAVVLWLMVALAGGWLLIRYGYWGFADTPFIFTKYGLPPQNFVPLTYLLSTLLVVVAVWMEYGWAWAVGAFVVASLVYGRIHAAAMRRANQDRYLRA